MTKKVKRLLSIGFAVVFAAIVWFIDPIWSYKDFDLKLAEFHSESSRSRPPIFRYERSTKSFFLHPGSNRAADVTMNFVENVDIRLIFSIRKESKVGNILFTIVHNDGKKSFVVKSGEEKEFELSVSAEDKIKILADKNGVTAGDWGDLKIFQVNRFYQIYTFVLIFLVFVTVLYFTRHHLFLAILFCSIFLFYLYAHVTNFGKMHIDVAIFYYGIALLMVSVLVVLSKFLPRAVFAFIAVLLSLVAILLPGIYSEYRWLYGATADKEVFDALFQTNTAEVMEFVKDAFEWYLLVAVLGGIVILIVIFYKSAQKIRTFSVTVAVVAPLFVAAIGYFISLKDVKIFYEPIDALVQYVNELKRMKEAYARRQSGLVGFKASKKEQNETYVVVIGESLNKHHMSLYGYVRKTTPYFDNLAQSANLVVFEHVISNHVQTMPAVTLALTAANQYNRLDFIQAPSLLDLFKSAGFKTYWITNQQLLSEWDNKVSILAHEADQLIPLNKRVGVVNSFLRSDYDEVVIEPLRQIIKSHEKRRLIIIHLMGNHIKYADRYPNKFNHFKNGTKALLGRLAFNRDVDSYDNSVLYNSYVVRELIKVLEQDKNAALMIYFSDHGEDIVKGLRHNPNKFTFDMIDIPFVVWFNEKYKEKYPSKISQLLSSRPRHFSNDLVFDLALGLAGIESNFYNPRYDPGSADFKLKPQDILTLHGRVQYVDNNNTLFWQQEIGKYIKERNLTEVLVATDVDSFGKAREVVKAGIKSIAFSVYEKNGKFYIDKERIVDLREHLSSLAKLDAIRSLYILGLDPSLFANVVKIADEFGFKRMYEVHRNKNGRMMACNIKNDCFEIEKIETQSNYGLYKFLKNYKGQEMIITKIHTRY